MKRELIETARLSLIPSDEAMAARVADYFRRNQDFLRPTEPAREPVFYTEPYWQFALRRDAAHAEKDLGARYWLEKTGQSGRIIGAVSLSGVMRGAFQSCCLSYRLDKDEQRQGYATEAAQAAVHVAFTALNLHRVEANIMPTNKPSIRVAQKLGFHEEGLAIRYLEINGRWEDHLRFAKLNE